MQYIFLRIEDIDRAQRFADPLASVNWPLVLNRHARKINPLMGSLLGRMQYCLSAHDQRIFKALLSGDNTINGFHNRDIRARLAGSPFLRTCGRCVVKQSAKISRRPKRFHIYGSIAKVPRSRRWRLTKKKSGTAQCRYRIERTQLSWTSCSGRCIVSLEN